MSVTFEDREQAAVWAVEALRLLGREDLLPYLTIEWSTRFTRRMGDALYCWMGETSRRSSKMVRLARLNGTGEAVARVRFSVPLWDRASRGQQHETVVHEIAHLVTHHEAMLAGKPRPGAHGAEWRAVMRRAGFAPKATHSVNRDGLARTRKTCVAHCDCRDHAITPAMMRKIGRGCCYICRRCNSYLLLGSRDSHLPRP
jgi:predicted SprT family Zn-dependent metalloprotease